MVTLTTKNFTALVQEWGAVAQASIARTRPTLSLSFAKGTILLALAEAQGSASLWLQGLILKLLTATRLSTSKGTDVDTWTADYMPGVSGGAVLPGGGISPRLLGNAASGLGTFARNVPTNPAIVPVGALVQSADGSQTYAVIADPTNGAYFPTVANGQPGYVIAATVLSLGIPIQFQFPANYIAGQYTGSVGNVQANAITILQTGISGVDTVTNNAPFQNGFLAESDDALKARFPLYIASLSKGTEGAIQYAAASVQQGIQVQIFEPGIGGYANLTIFVDDGSGAIPPATLALVTANIWAIKAAGVQPSIFGATQFLANVTMSVISKAGYIHTTVVAQVVAALNLYLSSLGLGITPAAGALSYNRLVQVAFDASPGVSDILGYTLNGSTLDLIPGNGQVIKPGAVIVS